MSHTLKITSQDIISQDITSQVDLQVQAIVDHQVAAEYWKQQIIPNPPIVQLPGDGIRSATLDQKIDSFIIPLSSSLRSRLELWSQTSGIPKTAIVLAIFNLLLYRYTDECNLLIATRQDDRSSLLRTDLVPLQSGEGLCRSVWETLENTRVHRRIPLADVIVALQPDRDLLFHPLTLFQCSSVTKSTKSKAIKSKPQQPQYDLDWTFIFDENSLDWQVDLRYRSSLFKPETLRRLVGHYQCLLDGLLQNPRTPIAQISLLTTRERQQILTSWNQTEDQFFPGFSPDRPIQSYIEEQVLRTPHAIAVRSINLDGSRQEMTYEDLNQRANQLAHYLRSLGIGLETASDPTSKPSIVAVCTDRTPKMVIALLGILKAGAAYLPLDPTYPHDRRVYKLEDSQTPLLFTQASLETTIVPDNFPGQVFCLDRDWDKISPYPTTNPPTLNPPDSLAYVIYTSGSTGKPKGVMIPHRGLVNHCFAMRKAFGLTSDDRMLQFSNMSFDIIIEELYPTLVTGATLVLRTDIIAASIDQFMTFVDTHRVTILDLPTAFWHELVVGMSRLQIRLPESVRLVVVGGEKASKQIYRQWLNLVTPEVRWLNTYGPTEGTVSATLYDPAQMGFDFDQPEIPIGRPIYNVKTYILDQHHQPVPVHIPGELYIGGPGVARGYLNREEQTRERFIPNPFSENPSDRLYSTGDVVRYLPNGTIEFVGRRDFEVKIQGFRIDLGEIERALESYDEIEQCVVVAHATQPDQKKLAAYLVFQADAKLTMAEVRSNLRTKLPDYMIPLFWVPMAGLPLTPNGKIDRKALPDPQESTPLPLQTDGHRDLVRPQGLIEEQLVTIWKQLLGIPDIGVTDNFFDLGGHSMLMMNLLVEIDSHWNRSLPITMLFQVPTIRQLAALIQDGQPIKRDTVVTFRAKGQEAPIFCVPGARGNLRYVHDLVKQMETQSGEQFDRPVYGLQEPIESDGIPLPKSLEAIAAYYLYEVQAIQPDGPYFLVGYSMGGAIAYEMAQQLREQGQEVALLGLLDPTPPYGRIRSRRLIQQLPAGHRSGLLVQLVLLRCMTLLDLYHLRLRQLKPWEIPGYLLQEWENESKSKAEENSNSNPITYDMVMKYDRVLAYYLPKAYSSPIKFFFSDEWQVDPANWRAWERLALKNLERYHLPGQHISFYQGSAMATIVQRLFT